MKKQVILTLSLLAVTGLFSSSSVQGAVAVNISAGQLLQADGTTPMQDGRLVQLIATTAASFTNPTATSFTGGASTDTVVTSFALDSTTAGVAGSFFNSGIDVTAYIGQKLLLRWYPTLNATSPLLAAGVGYGEFRTDLLPDGSTSAWVVPSNGSKDLNFLTTTVGGSQPNSAGRANSTIPVPEPSTFALLALTTVGYAMLRRHRS